MTAEGVVLLGTTTNYSGIIRVLQWLVIALVFLFFLRVIRAVWVEVRPAGPRQTRAGRRRAARDQQAALATEPPRRSGRRKRLFLEVVDPTDRAGQRFEIDDDLTVGRSPGCAIATNHDIYSSTLHARLYRSGDQVWVEDLGSTNGTFVNSERIARPVKLGRGDLLQVGGTVFEVTR